MVSDFIGIIEFDGQPAHFKALNAFGGLNGFVNTHNSDIIKNNLFEQLEMPFLRVRYDQINNIQEIQY